MAPPSGTSEHQRREATGQEASSAAPAPPKWQQAVPPTAVSNGPAAVGRGLPRPPSLVFDIELEERGSEGQGGAFEDVVGVRELTRWLLPSSTGEFKLRNDVNLGLAAQQQLQQQPSALEWNQKLAAYLTRLGYRVRIRTALGGGEGFECLRNLRHVFLAVMPPGAHATTNRFVVDLSFKEQFRIAKPSPRYQSLLDCLPDTYVAPEASVTPLVNFLCHEMALAFSSTGVVLPPWRQTHSMLSKWIPRKSLDEQVPRSAMGHTTLGMGVTSAGALHVALVANNAPPRRSMDVSAQVVHGHWVAGTVGAHQQQAQHDSARSCVAVQQQHQARGGSITLEATRAAAATLTRRHLSGPIKPMSCEPQRVVVGGNFSAIGFV